MTAPFVLATGIFVLIVLAVAVLFAGAWRRAGAGRSWLGIVAVFRALRNRGSA